MWVSDFNWKAYLNTRLNHVQIFDVQKNIYIDFYLFLN